MRKSHEASGRTYDAPWILCDLREMGERVAKNRVAKIIRRNKIRAQQFSVDSPDRVWVTDITYIRTFEGWLYPAVGRDG